jgi:putative NADH-flavin reductase
MRASARHKPPPARRLAIFGATGTVGSELLSQALAAGHEVRALVRNPSKLRVDDPRLTVLHGDVKDLIAVGATIKGCDAVLSALGATGTDDPNTRRTGTANVLTAMRENGIARVVVMGGFHVHLPGEDGNLGQKLIVPILRLSRVVVADTTGMGALVSASDLDWTFVRSPRVVRGGPTLAPRIGTLKLGPWSKATRGDVADFMLRCVDTGAYIRLAPMVSS